MFGVRHPIVPAPMGGSAAGAPAAAVSRGGGLGMLGAGMGDRDWPALSSGKPAPGTPTG
ncbi:hypothetical protein AB0C40_19420 [Streptomyces brevispora]|uniref:hypothetical protein n=1 Tax=Streptomyces brevispora TaxID=887462 RepID=UPI0033C53FFD